MREKLNAELETVQNNLQEAAGNVGSLRKIIDKAASEGNTLGEEIKKLTGQYNSHLILLRENGIQVGLTKVSEADRLRRDSQKEAQKLIESIGGLKEKQSAETNYVEILSESTANCPVCDTRLTAKQRKDIMREKTEEIKRIKTELTKKRKSEKNVSATLESVELIARLLKDISGRSNKLTKWEREAKSADRKLGPQNNRQERLDRKKAGIRNEIKIIEAKIGVAEKYESVTELSAQIKIIKKDLVMLPKISKEVERYKKAIKKQDNSKRKIQDKLAGIRPEIEALHKDQENAKIWYGKLKSAKKKMRVATEYAKEIGLAADAAKVTLHELFTSYSDLLNSNLRWIWPVLYPRTDLRNIELQVKIEETEERGERTLVTETQLTRSTADGQNIPFNTISSHGQRVLASIAFRVAFLNLLWKTSVPRILVLDEPTIWIDNQNRERLGQLLANLAREVKEGGIKLEQVIVISHDPAFLNAIDPEGVRHVCSKNEEGFCEVNTLAPSGV